MLSKRIQSAAVFIPVCLLVVYLGGWVFLVAAAIILGIGAWEFWHMFSQTEYSPNVFIIIIGTICLALSRIIPNYDYSSLIFSILVLFSMAYHTYAYEHGIETAGVDFCITLGVITYVGWLGGYIVALRYLPEGLYWIILSILGVGMSDIGAFLIGSRIGKHKISQRVSPNKSWEGYLGGILFACIFGAIFGMLIDPLSTSINAGNGFLLALAVSLSSLAGDLGESMLKRQFNLKDSSHLIPGHGGVLDRIDTWLWAGVISYYLILWLWIK